MGLFEKEFEFKGKHATYCRFLKDNGIISTFRDVYLISSVIGFLNGAKADIDDEKDENKKVQSASIMATELTQQQENLTFMYRIIMLLDDKPGFSIQDYQNRAFRDDADDEHPEKLKENMELFNSYVRGGLEILYDKFKDCEDVNEYSNTLYELVNDFAEDNGLAVEEFN